MKKFKPLFRDFCQELDRIKRSFGKKTEQAEKEVSPMEKENSVDNFLKGFGSSQGDE